MVQNRVQRPHPVAGDLDQSDARLLKPVGNPLSLFNACRRQRIRRPGDSFGRGSYRPRHFLWHLTRSRQPGSRQPAVTDHVNFPVEVNPSRGHNLSARREAANAVKSRNGTGKRFESPPDGCRFLVPLLIDQPLQLRLYAEYRGPRINGEGGAYCFDDFPIRV
jgi:hypothetical protein